MSTNTTLQSIEGYLNSKADSGDILAAALHSMLVSVIALSSDGVSIRTSTTDQELLLALGNRGYVVSAWSVKDLSFLDEDDDTATFNVDQLNRLKTVVFERNERSLGETLGQRGNELLEDLWSQNKAELIDASGVNDADAQDAFPKAEKHYQLGVRCDRDVGDIPRHARFVLTAADAIDVLKMASLVSDNGLHKAEKFDARASWLYGSDPDAFVEADSEVDTICVSATEFWFTAYLENTDVELRTERQPISELVRCFGITIPAKPELK